MKRAASVQPVLDCRVSNDYFSANLDFVSLKQTRTGQPGAGFFMRGYC